MCRSVLNWCHVTHWHNASTHFHQPSPSFAVALPWYSTWVTHSLLYSCSLSIQAILQARNCLSISAIFEGDIWDFLESMTSHQGLFHYLTSHWHCVGCCIRWHVSANAKPKEKRVQHYKTRAHHFKKHKGILENAVPVVWNVVRAVWKWFCVFWNGVRAFCNVVPVFLLVLRLHQYATVVAWYVSRMIRELHGT